MAKANLVGYIRKKTDGNALKVCISVKAFGECEKYTTRDGQDFVDLIVRLDKIQMLIGEEREVIGISQIVGG